MSVEFRGHVLAPESLGPCRVVVEGDRIAAIEPSRDAPEGTWIVPGLVDIQLNGAFGVDFATPDGLDAARARVAASGVTTFLATLVSAPPGAYAAPLAALVPDEEPGLARLAGVHLEGPWLSSTYPGAHDPAALRPPSAAELTAFLASGTVRLVTLAPELTGGLAAVSRLTDAGVVVALGHTNADEVTTRAAVRAGATIGTHLFNAMRPFHHRDPGAAGALLDARCAVTLIADGVHVSDAALRLAWAAKGVTRFALISDGVAPLGMPPGRYRVGTWDVTSDGAVCRLAGGTLAGSVTPLIAGVRRLVACGVRFAEAIRAATETPAGLVGIDAGHLTVGGRADLVVLDDGLRPVAVLAGGVSPRLRQPSPSAR
jgi:N-acetylglucosamine-6-phosphate deacetylase